MTDHSKTDAQTDTHAPENLAADGSLDDYAPDQADQLPDLFTPDAENALPLPLDATVIAGDEKRARGRPKGAKNKKEGELLQYLMARGFNSPLEAGAALYNMNTLELTRQIIEWRRELKRDWQKNKGYDDEQMKVMEQELPVDPLEVLKLQTAVMAAHLPYWHAKKTPDEAPTGHQLPVMIIGEMNTQINNSGGAMSAGIPPETKIVDNQHVSHDETVRHNEHAAHDTD